MGRKGRRRRGDNQSTCRGTLSPRPSTKDEIKNKQEKSHDDIQVDIQKRKEHRTNMTEDQKRKLKDKEESTDVTSSGTPFTTKVAENQNTKTNIDSEKPASDKYTNKNSDKTTYNKAADNSTINAATRKEPGVIKEKGCSDDVKKNRSYDQRALEVKQLDSSENENVAETKTEVNVFTPFFQSFKDIDERKLNFDLNVLKVQQELFSKDKCNLTEPQSEEQGKIIYLKGDVNLSFEFDTFGKKYILLDDKIPFSVDEKQKITFNIGVGNVKFSFIDNKVSIFIQEGEIDCHMFKNRVKFSLTNSTADSDPLPAGPTALVLSDSTDTTAITDLDSLDIVDVTRDSYFIQSKERDTKNES